MNRPFWITLALSAIVATTAYVALGLHNKRLSDQLAAGQGAEEQTPSRPSKSDRTPSPPLSSEEKIERASEGVDRFIASLDAPEGSKASELTQKLTVLDSEAYREATARRIMFWENLPDLLMAVEGLSAEELLAVARQAPDADTNQPLIGQVRPNLIMLAAAQDPLRILRDDELRKEVGDVAMMRCLAGVDAAKAMRLMPEIEALMDKKTRERFGAVMLGADVELGLQLLLEMREGDPDREEGMRALNGGLGFGHIPLPTATIPKLVEAMDNPGYGAIRNDIIKTVLDYRLGEQGVAETARQARAMALEPQEIGLYLDSVGENLIATSPRATLAWMGNALDAEQQSQRIPEAVVAWANRDVEAASTWLGGQEPSPVMDQTIARFATSASDLDPAAAVAWAKEIQDEDLREETLREVGKR